MKMKTRFTTAVSFWEKVSTYTDGEGYSTNWKLFSEGFLSVFPCEWRMNFRTRYDQNFDGDAEGSIDFVRVRMPYIPSLYDKLRTASMVIIKGTEDHETLINGEPNPGNPNVYMLWGGVDNMQESNQYMEFACRRYEVN